MCGCPGTPGPWGWVWGPIGPVGPGPHIPGAPWGCIPAEPIMPAAGPMGWGPGWCGEPTMWGPGWWGCGEGPPPPMWGCGAWGEPLIIPWGIGWGLGEAPLRWGPPVTPPWGVGGPPWVGVVAGWGGGRLGGPVGPVAASGGSGPFAILLSCVSEAAADAIACKGFVAPLVLTPRPPVPPMLWLEIALLFWPIRLLQTFRPLVPAFPLLLAPGVLLTLFTPPPRDCKDGGSGGEPAGGAAGPPRHRPDGPGAVTLLGATGTPAWSGIPPGGRCATLTGITPPSTTPFTLSSNSRRPEELGTSAGIYHSLILNFFA